MASKAVMEKYAKLAVVSGVNVQPGQMLVISASVTDYEFVRMCVKAAYEAGAGYVKINWHDEQDNLMNYQYASTETLEETPQWKYDMTDWEHKKGCCYLHVISDTPGLMKDIDPAKIQRVQAAYSKKNAPLKKYTMNNDGQWSIVALPSAGWANKVFPDKKEDEAVEALMDADVLADSDALVEALIDALVLADSLALVEALIDADVLADSDALVEALIDADVLADSDALVDALCEALVLADSLALVEALMDADVLADSLALVEALIDADVLADSLADVLVLVDSDLYTVSDTVSLCVYVVSGY